MNSLTAFALLTLMQQQQNEKFPSEELSEEPEPPPPPWVNARYDIPKSLRKGKTWEEILEIKKQIWLDQHPQGSTEQEIVVSD